MFETDVYSYYAFGYNYHILSNGCAGKRVHGQGDTLGELLKEFFEHLNNLNLQVTSQAADNLRKVRERLDSLPEDAKVDGDLAHELVKACQKLDVTLDSELRLRTSFIVTPGRFRTEHLLEEPWELLGGGTFERIPDIATFDFISACRAVAFGLATSAAFHVMRCVEAMLRKYYTTVIKRGRIKQLMWAQMIQHLRKKKREAPPRALLDHMDNIRVNFRNPTQHPDARYELDEAQDLLSVSIDALNRMARDLAAREQVS